MMTKLEQLKIYSSKNISREKEPITVEFITDNPVQLIRKLTDI